MPGPGCFPYQWVTLSNDSSEIEMECFIDKQKRWLKKVSQHEACQVCPVRHTEHTQHYAIYKCKSATCAEAARGARALPCSWFVRTTLCDLTKRGSIEQNGQHISSAPDEALTKLNFTMKRFIRDKVKDKFKPSRILNAMIDAGFFSTDASSFKGPVTGYANRYRTRGLGDNNSVDAMEALLANRQYHAGLPEDAAFGFGFPTNDSGKPSLSTGTKSPSSIRSTLTRRSSSLTMADADLAQRNALDAVVTQDLNQSVPPVNLMCFFHVMQNVRKYLMSVPKGLHPSVMKRVVSHPRAARSEVEIDNRVHEAIQDWKDQPALRDYERLFSQQWLCGRFTRWQCFNTPEGYAKTNNPVEKFNKEIKRDYTLRSLVSVNAQAQAFFDMCYHRACRARPFATTPKPSEKQAARYRALERQGRLEVWPLYRSSVTFMLEGGDRKLFRVIQHGVDTPNPARKTPLTTIEELDKADEAMEIQDQPRVGWFVDVDAGSCECRNRRKFGYCVHLIAARIYEDLVVEG